MSIFAAFRNEGVHRGLRRRAWRGPTRMSPVKGRARPTLYAQPAVRVVTNPDRQPHAPWCATLIEPGLAGHTDAASWLGALELCLAWAWLAAFRSPALLGGARLCRPAWPRPWRDRSPPLHFSSASRSLARPLGWLCACAIVIGPAMTKQDGFRCAQPILRATRSPEALSATRTIQQA
jgi:hypothetical protein